MHVYKTNISKADDPSQQKRRENSKEKSTHLSSLSRDLENLCFAAHLLIFHQDKHPKKNKNHFKMIHKRRTKLKNALIQEHGEYTR